MEIPIRKEPRLESRRRKSRIGTVRIRHISYLTQMSLSDILPARTAYRLPGNSNEGGRCEKEHSVPSVLFDCLRYLHPDLVRRRPVIYHHDSDVRAYDLRAHNQPSTVSYDCYC